MPWKPTDATLDDVETDVLWSASGARWLTERTVPVPAALVRRVVGLVDELDRRGAGLTDMFGSRGLGVLAERAAMMGLPPSGRTSAGGATRLLRVSDDWIALSLARSDDLAVLPAWLDGEIDVWDLDARDDAVVSDDVWTAVELAVAERGPRDLVERATLLGLPCSLVGETTDARSIIAESFGDASPRSLEGALVVNLASLWAGPLCADVLGRLGARVVAVESTSRPDGGRLAARFFEALHGRSESVALDLASRSGQSTLAALLRRADVVIEGSRPRALEQMGIDANRVVQDGPQVWLSITAHGRGEGARDRVGFGDDAAAAGGLVGWAGGEPRFLGDAIGDPLAGLSAACVIAGLLDQGGRWLVDLALARVAKSVDDATVDHGDNELERPRPRTDPGAPMPLGHDTDRVLSGLGIARSLLS